MKRQEKNSKEKKKKEMGMIWVNSSEQCCVYQDTHADLGASVKMARQGCRLRYVCASEKQGLNQNELEVSSSLSPGVTERSGQSVACKGDTTTLELT